MAKPKYPRARRSPTKDELLVIAITRESVVTSTIRPLLDKLLPLAATRLDQSPVQTQRLRGANSNCASASDCAV
jgi:hypothetical protein